MSPCFTSDTLKKERRNCFVRVSFVRVYAVPRLQWHVDYGCLGAGKSFLQNTDREIVIPCAEQNMGQYQIHLCWLSKILFCPLPTSIEAIWSPFYWHGLILTQPWISNDIRYKVWGWIISSHTLLGMWLPIHAALMWNKLSWHCHCPPFWWICMIISMLLLFFLSVTNKISASFLGNHPTFCLISTVKE